MLGIPSELPDQKSLTAAEQGAVPNRLHISKIIRSTDWTEHPVTALGIKQEEFHEHNHNAR